MAIKFEKLQVGQTYYDRHKYQMGNTTIRSIGEWSVKILEIDSVKRMAYVVWNGNSHRPSWWNERSLCKLFDWSMEDDCAEVKTGRMLGNVISVRKKRASKQ